MTRQPDGREQCRHRTPRSAWSLPQDGHHRPSGRRNRLGRFVTTRAEFTPGGRAHAARAWRVRQSLGEGPARVGHRGAAIALVGPGQNRPPGRPGGAGGARCRRGPRDRTACAPPTDRRCRRLCRCPAEHSAARSRATGRRATPGRRCGRTSPTVRRAPPVRRHARQKSGPFRRRKSGPPCCVTRGKSLVGPGQDSPPAVQADEVASVVAHRDRRGGKRHFVQPTGEMAPGGDTVGAAGTRVRRDRVPGRGTRCRSGWAPPGPPARWAAAGSGKDRARGRRRPRP